MVISSFAVNACPDIDIGTAITDIRSRACTDGRVVDTGSVVNERTFADGSVAGAVRVA